MINRHSINLVIRILLLQGVFEFNTALALSISPVKPIINIEQRIALTAIDAKGDVHWAAIKGFIIGSGKTVTYVAPGAVGIDSVVIQDDETSASTEITIQNRYINNIENSVWEITQSEVLGSSPTTIQCLLSDNQGGFWAGTNNGLAHREANGRWTLFNESNSGLPDNTILSLLSDENGGLWIGTLAGLAHLAANGQWIILNTHNSGLRDETITTILSDNKSGLWIGTLHGLYHLEANGKWSVRFDNPTFAPFSPYVNKLLSDGEGGFWVGLKSFGSSLGLVHQLADGKMDWYFPGLLSNEVTDLVSDDKGGIWLGTDIGLENHGSNGTWSVFNQTNSDLSSFNFKVNKLTSDLNGGLWVGTEDKGLIHLKANGQWTVFNKTNSGLPSNKITALLSDDHDGLWVGFADDSKIWESNDKLNGLRLAYATFTAKDALCKKVSKSQCDILQNNRSAAIIIAGGGKQNDNSLWNTTNHISNQLYKILNNRGFNNDEIFYVSPNTDADFTGDGLSDHIVDAPKRDKELAIEDIQAAIDWATQRGELKQPLFLFFIDHGSPDKFYLSRTNFLMIEQFRKMLDDYQTKTGNEVVIVIDACFSGEIGKKLKAPKRAIITSTDNSYAYFNRLTYEGFSLHLGQGLDKGMTFGEAFEYASAEQRKLLNNLGLRVVLNDDAMVKSHIIEQKPQKLDNNLVNTLDKLFLNGSFVTADTTLTVNSLTDNATRSADTHITLKANASVSQGEIQQVWAVVRPPRIDLLFDQYNTPILAFPRVNLSPTGKDNLWQGIWQDNHYNGEYSITFYAKDKENNIVSSDINNEITITDGVDPPQHASTQINLNQNHFKVGDILTASVTEEMYWGYDLYLAVKLPSGDFLTLDDKNSFNAINKASPWRANRLQGLAQDVLNLALPNLPKGQYCLYALLSPEQESVFQAKSYWKSSQQCFDFK